MEAIQLPSSVPELLVAWTGPVERARRIRELGVLRGVTARKSNKAMERELSISPRTVGTHLANIYQKLGVNSRAEFADRAHDQRLLEASAE